MPKRLTHDEFVERLHSVNPHVEVLSEYNGNKQYITVRCLIDGNVWKTKPNWLIKGCRCSLCYHRENANMRRLPLEEFIKRAKVAHSGKYDYSKVNYVNSDTKVIIICPKHGEFWQSPNKHINYKQGCPLCNESKLEHEVQTMLDKHNIKYEREKHFTWLGLQSLDFYLPNCNIAIECQGIQHFEPIKFFGGNEGFKNTVQRDFNKKILCENNKIKLIYITNNNFLGIINKQIFNNIYVENNCFGINDERLFYNFIK